MNSYIRCKELKVDSECLEKLQRLYPLYLEHRFNLLGSGIVKVNYELRPEGLHGIKYDNPSMAKYRKKALKKLNKVKINIKDYEPINWFADYKSGFFFDPDQYCSLEKCQAAIGKMPGVDIKCPWELGRFYHLTQMAILAVEDDRKKRKILREFVEEFLDFTEMNPVGKTVQWACPMDAAIRTVNFLVTYDLLSQIDEKGYLNDLFKKRFEILIKNSLKYLMNAIQYGKSGVGNHYLATVVGIIFSASYLEEDTWTDACLVFGVQELIEQVGKQFYKDGGNYEGSTSYHRLSAELVTYATALIYGVLKTNKRRAFTEYDCNKMNFLKPINRQKYKNDTGSFFPQWYVDKLISIGAFNRNILKQNNEIVQIGDNDSGRLLKLTVLGDGIKENVLDHRPLLSAISGMVDDKYYENIRKIVPLECSFIESLSKGKKVKGVEACTLITSYGKELPSNFAFGKESIIYQEADQEEGLKDGIRINYFSDFGIIILRSKRLFFSLVIDTAKNTNLTGHTHNDKLSVEVMVDRTYITRDAGQYIYTPMPVIRDRFRSVNAHNIIHVDGCEQNVFEDCFTVKKRCKAQLLFASRDKVIGKAMYAGIVHQREIEIMEHAIIVRDYANYPFKVSFKNKIYSTGYGELVSLFK